MDKETKQYKQHMADIVKFLIKYGNSDAKGKTLIMMAYDETDRLESRTFLMGDPEVISHSILAMMDQLPPEEQVHMLAHLVNEDAIEEVLLDLMELKEHGELEFDEE